MPWWKSGTATTTYSSDVVNQYTSIASVSRTHDDNGNLADDGNQEYIYDYANHLIEVKASGSSTIATYMYDALGRRVEKDVSGGSVTRYLLWGQSIIQEVDGSGTWLARYVQTDRIDFPCAMDRADIADVDGDTNTTEVLRFHYHQQALGSVAEISDENGAVVEWVTYDVYGAPTIRDQAGSTATSSAVGSPFLYTGREYDAESGLYHYRARAYDPEAGRFLQRDPLGYADGLGLLEYCASAPASRRDPLGTKSIGDLTPGELQELVNDIDEAASENEEYKELEERVDAALAAHNRRMDFLQRMFRDALSRCKLREPKVIGTVAALLFIATLGPVALVLSTAVAVWQVYEQVEGSQEDIDDMKAANEQMAAEEERIKEEEEAIDPEGRMEEIWGEERDRLLEERGIDPVR